MNDRDIEDTRQPFDDAESILCDGCGEEMDEDWLVGKSMGWSCRNGYCPSKFDGRSKNMAISRLELLDNIGDLEFQIERLVRVIQSILADANDDVTHNPVHKQGHAYVNWASLNQAKQLLDTVSKHGKR